MFGPIAQIMNGGDQQQGLLAKILGMNGQQGAPMGQPTMTGSPMMSPQLSASGPLDKIFGKVTGK